MESTDHVKRGYTFTARNSHQLSIVVVPIIMVSIATICMVLRFRARKIQRVPILYDDWIALFSLVLVWAFQCVNMAAVFAGGAGLPVQEVVAVDPNKITVYLKIIVANFSLWIITVSLVQLSVIFFYLRVFSIKTVFRWCCYVFIFAIIGLGIGGFVSEILGCIPVSALWTPAEMPDATCVDQQAACGSIGLIHCVFDFLIVAMPIPMVWRLQMSKKNKIVLTGVLTVGLSATVVSLLKISCLIDLTHIPASDVTDSLWLVILLQTIELPIGLICCCIPTLAPAVQEMKSGFSSITSRFATFRSGSTSSRDSKGQPTVKTGAGTVDATRNASYTRADSYPPSSKLGHSIDKTNASSNDEFEMEPLGSRQNSDRNLNSSQIKITKGWHVTDST